MLKNTRNYLKDELYSTYEYIKELQEEYDWRVKEYDEAKTLITPLKEKRVSEYNLFGSIIVDWLLGGSFACMFYIVEVPFLIPILVGLFAIISLHIGFSIKRVVKANKSFKKIYEESDYEFKALFEPPLNYQRFIDRRYNKPIKRLEEDIKNNQEFAYILWETLSSDDFIEMLEKYHEYHVFEEALESEWEAYWEELFHIKAQDIHLKRLKEEKPNFVIVEKKLNLAIK